MTEAARKLDEGALEELFAGLPAPDESGPRVRGGDGQLDAFMSMGRRKRPDEPRGPRKFRGICPAEWARARETAQAMMGLGDWSGALPRHFAALYEILHERVYGVGVAELNNVGRGLASAAAGRLLKTQFDDDPAAMAEYMRWAWRREDGREKWRRANAREGGRISWRLMFNGMLVTDYRVECRRGVAR